jgi:hypothetical protein
MPLSDIITTAQSGDGSHHTVSVYFDISGEWASGLTGINNQSAALINWTPESINRNSEAAARRHAVDLDRDADFADWGTVLR